MQLIDLSHTFKAGMPVYPGDTPPVIEQVSFLEKHGYVHFKVHTGMHVGTHIDAPMHFIQGGKRLSEIPLERFIGRGVLIEARGHPTIDVDLLENKEIRPGDVVLIHTGFDAHFGETKYFTEFPVMTEAFAQRLVEIGVNMVGMDTSSPERDAPFPCHQLLLKNEILILENLMNLQSLNRLNTFEVIAFPPKFELDGSPVRVVARALSHETKQ